MKTVFILGAGASAEAGAPLMAGFLHKAKQLHGRGAFGADAPSIEDVLNAAYKDLRPVHVKSNLDYENIEELFSAIDIGQLIGSFGSRQKEKIDALRESIVTFIYRTIEETIKVPINGGSIGAAKGYSQLAALVRKTLEATARLGRKDVSFISFNYDACLEHALALSGIGVDYCLGERFAEERVPEYQVNVPVLKLHGSINWGLCSACNTIVPTELNPWTHGSRISFLDHGNVIALPYGSRVRKMVHHCGTVLNPLPFLIPPTWSKASTVGGLKNVWKQAALEIGSAENIVVIGYSLPPTDMFFKYLFALGSNSDIHLEKFLVINGPNSEITKQRFEALLGPMTVKGFDFQPFVFSGASSLIQNVLHG